MRDILCKRGAMGFFKGLLDRYGALKLKFNIRNGTAAFHGKTRNHIFWRPMPKLQDVVVDIIFFYSRRSNQFAVDVPFFPKFSDRMTIRSVITVLVAVASKGLKDWLTTIPDLTQSKAIFEASTYPTPRPFSVSK